MKNVFPRPTQSTSPPHFPGPPLNTPNQLNPPRAYDGRAKWLHNKRRHILRVHTHIAPHTTPKYHFRARFPTSLACASARVARAATQRAD